MSTSVATPRPRRAMTLRTKLIVGIVALIIGLSAGIGVVTEIFLGRYLTQQVDQRLSTVDGFGRGGTPPGGAATGPSPIGLSCTAPSDTARYRLRDQTDQVLALVSGGSVTKAILRETSGTCTELTHDDLTALDQLIASTSTGSGRGPTTLQIGTHGDFRVMAQQPGAGTNSGTYLLVGLSLSEVSSTQARLAIIMALVAGSAVLVGAGVVFLIVRRSVRPLERVAATARKVSTLPLDKGEVDLSVRVPDQDTDTRTEIGQVGAALNQMLGHVSGALEARHASETRVRQFVADASHELRTPLAAIRGYAELARRGEHDPAAVTHALRRVESESSRMTTLVEDLLLLARLDSGRPLATEEVDLTMLVVDRVSDARVAGPDHRWRLDLPEEPVTIVGDTARLHQVLANLLTNARNHTPPGTSVVTGLQVVADGVMLTVTDDGPGIPAEFQPEIFGRFVRGDSSRSRAAGSTGLGLAIVAAVIAAHGGKVTVDSRPGRTQARVWLPTHSSSTAETYTPQAVSTVQS